MAAKKKKPRRWHVVRRSKIHGRGIFARGEIPRGTKIIEYVGERITKAESQKRADRQLAKAKKSGIAAVFIFDLSKRFDLDGNVPWNTARLINHSCAPNCEAIDIRGRIWICARRKIRAGEELSYNYGYDLEDWHDHPCRCGADACPGYIAARKFWRKLRSSIARKVIHPDAHAPHLHAEAASDHPEIRHGS